MNLALGCTLHTSECLHARNILENNELTRLRRHHGAEDIHGDRIWSGRGR